MDKVWASKTDVINCTEYLIKANNSRMLHIKYMKKKTLIWCHKIGENQFKRFAATWIRIHYSIGMSIKVRSILWYSIHSNMDKRSRIYNTQYTFASSLELCARQWWIMDANTESWLMPISISFSSSISSLLLRNIFNMHPFLAIKFIFFGSPMELFSSPAICIHRQSNY